MHAQTFLLSTLECITATVNSWKESLCRKFFVHEHTNRSINFKYVDRQVRGAFDNGGACRCKLFAEKVKVNKRR